MPENENASLQSAGPVLEFQIDNLRELCRVHGIDSLRELGDRIGVDPTTMWRIENGITRPSPRVIASVKVAFPMSSFDDLLQVSR